MEHRYGTGPGRSSSFTLPYATNDLNLPPVVINGAGSIAGSQVCAGASLQFVSSLSPFVTAAAYSWNFGDPASDSRNTAASQAPAHTYQQPGTYTVTLGVTAADGRQFATTTQVQVLPLPVIDLGPDLTLCADEQRILTPGPQPTSTTFRWHDGSTGSQLAVTLPGTYGVTVTSPSGCSGTAEVRVVLAAAPTCLTSSRQTPTAATTPGY